MPVMDYRVIDTLQADINALSVEVERRHAIIAERNAAREPGTPEVVRSILLDCSIQEHTAQAAKEARAVLLETLATVEAGEPLPGFIRDFLAYLNDIAPLLSYDARTARIWETQAGELLSRLAPYLAQESTKAAGMGSNPAAGMEEPREPLCIPTTKSREDLARIFHALVKAGYISGLTPEALPDFLNAFTKGAEKQGRVTWVWKAKNGGISPLQILDFAAQMAGKWDEVLDPDFTAAVSAIFAVSISASTKHRYNTINGTATSADLSRIIAG